jgi:hypothetical protein
MGWRGLASGVLWCDGGEPYYDCPTVLTSTLDYGTKSLRARFVVAFD